MQEIKAQSGQITFPLSLQCKWWPWESVQSPLSVFPRRDVAACSRTPRLDRHHPGYLFPATLPTATEVSSAQRKGEKSKELGGSFPPSSQPGCKEASSHTVAVIRQIHLPPGSSTCFLAVKDRCKLLCDLGLSGSVAAVPDSWDGHIQPASHPDGSAISVFGVWFLTAS